MSPTFCFSCGGAIPADRMASRNDIVTCSDACQTKRLDTLREIRDAKKCRYCMKPSTPAQRKAYKRFRELERRNPQALYPEAYEIWRADLESKFGAEGLDKIATTKAFKLHMQAVTDNE